MQKNKINQENLIKFIKDNTFNHTESIEFSIDPEDKDLIKKYKNMKNEVSIALDKNFSMGVSSFELTNFVNKILQSPNIAQTEESKQLLEKALLESGHDSDRDEINENYSIVHLGPKEFNLYTSQNQLQMETRLLELILEQNENFNFRFPKDTVNEYIEDIIKKSRYRPSQQQIKAIDSCLQTNTFAFVLEGLAGAGKSTTLGNIVQFFKNEGYEPQGVALSWAAADVLSVETGMVCHSIDQFIHSKNNGDPYNPFDRPTLILVDESGLVGVHKMLTLLEIIKKSKHPVKVILSGDSTQLNPINDPNSLELITKILPEKSKSTLDEIRRQSSRSHREAVKLLRTGHSGQALYIFHQQEVLHLLENQQDVIQKVTEDYFSALKNNPDDSMIIIAMNHNIVYKLNQNVRHLMIKLGKIDQNTEIKIPVIRKSQAKNSAIPVEEKFAVGDNIVFLKNRKDIFLKDIKTHKEYMFLANNTTGRISKITGNPNDGYDITAHIEIEDDNRQKVLTYVNINTKNYSNSNRGDEVKCCINLNYATVAYSSQGQTVKKAFFIDDPVMMNRRYAYVACSRHRESLNIYINKESYKNLLTKKDPEKNVETIDILNSIGSHWGRPKDEKSIVVKFLEILDNFKNIKHNNVQYSNLDFNNLPDNFMSDIYRKHIDKIKYKEQQKYYFQNNNDNYNILDTPDFYQKKYERADLDELKNINNAKIIYNPDLAEFDHIPTQDREEYFLSPILNEDLFTALKGTYFDVGRGGELRFLATSRNNDEIISKYNIYGEDVLNIGYPYFVSAGSSGVNTDDIIIIQDLNNFLQYFENFYLKNKSFIQSPTIIWGTDDIKYKFIINRFDNANVTFIGDEEFKKNHFLKITQSIKGHELKSTKFNNFSKNDLDSSFLNPDKSGRVNSQFRGIIFSHDYEKNFLFDDIETLNPKEHLDLQKFIKQENYLCNGYGELNSELLTDILIKENIVTEQVVEEIIMPTRSDFYDGIENIKNNLKKLSYKILSNESDSIFHNQDNINIDNNSKTTKYKP